MCTSDKLTNFIQNHKDKTKDEVVKLLMEEFNYKESTAIVRYYDYRDKHKKFREVAFDFFNKNPNALVDIENKTYAEALGMTIATYAVYKSQYKSEKEKERKKLLGPKVEHTKKEIPQYGEKYYKGKLREKFTFDDSRL